MLDKSKGQKWKGINEIGQIERKFGPFKGTGKYLSARSKRGAKYLLPQAVVKGALAHFGAPVWVTWGEGQWAGREMALLSILVSHVVISANEVGTVDGAMRGTKMGRLLAAMLKDRRFKDLRNGECSPKETPKESNWNDLRGSESIRRESRINCTKPNSKKN